MAMLNNQMVNVNDTVAGVIIHQTNPTYLFWNAPWGKVRFFVYHDKYLHSDHVWSKYWEIYVQECQGMEKKWIPLVRHNGTARDLDAEHIPKKQPSSYLSYLEWSNIIRYCIYI